MGALEANQIVEMLKLKQRTVYNDQERRFPRVKGNHRAAVRLDPHRFLRINIRKHNHPLHHTLSRCWTSCLHWSPPISSKESKRSGGSCRWEVRGGTSCCCVDRLHQVPGIPLTDSWKDHDRTVQQR